jgi:hypothetical protein
LKKNAALEKLNLPEWTESKTKDGLDPLGMQNSSVSLYQELLPGIGNVTLRIRYYGLYAWLSWMYADRIGSTDPEKWRRFIRRAEALYALIASRHGNESGVAGSRWAKRRLDNIGGKTIDFQDDSESSSSSPYFAVKWGVFGLAYQSQLLEIGVLYQSDEHRIAVPSKHLGEPLAKAFQKSLGELADPFYRAFDRARVSLDELDRLSPLSASEIRKGSTERNLYEELLFGEHQSSDASDRDRRLSLTLVLKVAAQLKRMPTAEDVRWTFYAAKDERGRSFSGGELGLEAQRKRWFVYQANDLCHLSLETLLKFALDTLEEFPQGIPPADLIRRCVSEILSVADSRPKTWAEFAEGVSLANNANDLMDAHSELALAEELMPIRSPLRRCTPAIAWKAIKLLAIVQKRQEAHHTLVDNALQGFDPQYFHSLLTERRFLTAHSKIPFSDAIASIIDERVVSRHLWIALRKFRYQGDYTFLIESDDGQIRLRDKDGPVLTNPRLRPAIWFLQDIHLIDDSGLTERGERLLERL